MGKTDDSHALASLAEALSELADRLEPGEVARAARLVVEAMGKTRNPSALYSLAGALSKLSGRLEPAEASRQTARAARLVAEAMGKTDDPSALYPLALALPALAGRLEPAEAMKAARLLVEAIGKTNYPQAQIFSQAQPFQAGALSALAGRLGPAEAINRAIVAARAIGEELSPPTRLSGLATLLLQASQLPPCRFSPQELIELLKMPTCVGPAREVVLRLLGRTYDRHFADLWEFVDWVHEHHPELDLTTPPQRPQ
jgi:hypothetical protein